MNINKTIKNILITFALLFFLVFIWVLWHFGLFRFGGESDTSNTHQNVSTENRSLSRDEQKEILKNLAPTKKLTEKEKTDQLKILENLSNQKTEKNDSLNILNSLDSGTSEEEQLKLLESLKK